jgi:YesN/AraC family two-component response regulator
MDDKFQNLKVVVTAVDGFDALSKIAQANPDIVFVDIMISMAIKRVH